MLVLASASPRRKEAFAALGIPVRVVPSGMDESRRPGETPEAFAGRTAREKAQAVARRLARAGERPWVLGADTVVALGDEVLGKPSDRPEARRMIARLAGRTHRVATAWALIRDRAAGREGIAVSDVEFRPLSEAEIDRYVESGEGDDKAGAYAIQGLGIWLVESLHGSLTSVVCLPVGQVLCALREVGCLR